MSKHREPITVEPPVSQITKPAPTEPVPPAQVPIGGLVGSMCSCPACGKPAYVTDARGTRTATQVVSSRWWVMVKCTGHCGNMLRKTATLVIPLPDVPVPVVTTTVGAAVGKSIKCPRCSGKALVRCMVGAEHMIHCVQCGAADYPSETVVELA
jgi:hypothetical protein